MTTSSRMSAVFVLAVFCSGLTFSAARLAEGAKPGGGTTTPYSLTDLKGFTGGAYVQGYAYDISDPDASGIVEIVGGSLPQPGSRIHPALWRATSGGTVLTLTDLGLPEGAGYCPELPQF